MKSRAENWMLVLCSAGLLCMILVSTVSLSTQATSPVPDFDGNGIVDFSDFVAFAMVFGAQQGDEAYDIKYDLDANGEIGFGDFVIFAQSFGKAVNSAPVFTDTPPITRTVVENTAAGQPIGDPVSATDAKGDTLTYKLTGPDASSFAIDTDAGQLQTKEGISYDHETKEKYSVIVGVSDGEGASASAVVNIAVTDVEEPPAVPPSQIVVTAGDSALTVTWNAANDEVGKPPVIGYELLYRQGDSSDWQSGGILNSRTDTSLTLIGLTNDLMYQMQVRTINDEGASKWSTPVSGTPVTLPEVTIAAGTTPVTEGTAATFTITASTAPASALTVGVSVTQTGDVIGGTPASSVTIDANKTAATLTVATDDDSEDESNGVVTAEVQTGTGYTVGSTSSASVTVNDNDERRPAASVVISPDKLAFTSVGASATLTGRILDANGNATNPTSLGWTSANREVATVTSLTSLDLSRPKATVKAIGAGTTTITLGVDDGVTGTATVTVTLMGRRVKISPGRLKFDALGQTKMVTVKVLDENDDEDTEASFSAFSAFSPLRGTTIGDGGLDIEKVDGGIQITSNENGIGSITISSAGAESAILPVSVAQSPASLVVSPDSVGLAVGATATLSAAISDANGHGIGLDQGDGQGGLMVYWETSDSAVATVAGATATNDGNSGGTATVTAAGAGAATITGRWGSYIRGTAKVTVTAGN